MNTFWEQILALVAFFAFPAMQYILLKWYVTKEGQPELWYLPAYGFRLVIRNIPRKKTLSDIHYRALLREKIEPAEGASVASYMDNAILEREDMFLFPGTDQVLISFQLDELEPGQLQFVSTDKLGEPIHSHSITKQTTLVVDYTANVENWFNFDMQVAKRAELTGERMWEIYNDVHIRKKEKRFALSRIRSIG